MAKNIEPKLRKIGDYLQLEDDTVFIIPEYQRPYSWGTDHCDKLWQDIEDFIASDSKDRYFFGTIIINCQDNDTKFGLIDGQQRTTTFLLLLKALLVRINVAIGKTEGDEDSENLCRGLKERRRRIMGILYKAETEDIPDKPDIKRDTEICSGISILENYSINEHYKTELNTILQSVDYVEAESKVIKIPRKQKDNRYTNFFRNFKYFYEMIDSLSESELNKMAKAVTDSCEVIEIKSWQVEQAITMFNSLNSDGLPLYDADIISAQLYAEAEKQGSVDKFKVLWKELLDTIEELKEAGIANIDSILMQQMYYVRTVKKETVSDTGSINVTTPGLRRYFTEINKDLLNHPIELCEGMINLSKIWLKISNYPIAQVLFKFNENTKLFLASFFYRFKEEDVTEESVKTILESVLRLFTIMEVVDIGYSSSNFKTFLFGEEVKFVDPTISVEEIKADFDKHISEKWSRDAIKAAIKDYDKHMLVYLNEFLFAKEKGLDFSIGAKYDIEHIMPYSGKNLSEIRKDADIESEEEFRNIVNKLGNKILLEEKINRSIGNEWFRTKISTRLGNRTGYIDSKYPIASTLVADYKNVNKPYWKKEDIITATEAASERIVKFIFGF
ncbi:Protein of unknown function [Oribacterium sp. KHPX15]|uniref:DUF262 domain-containing protein n=1 Tax=Oribacterium sp. KHPX15 TaxID=1855342 RepID=UPI00089BBBD1|nr:DUF262 domain-containing protein [Oribacterium sp. KHPX15]SEA17779.1 Protein of unknown function [Oribacterium sp. KHPX15]